jgi:hypothetical protein
MLTLTEIRQNRTLANSIDWAMTPEKAVEMYLEWGTSWSRGNDFVSSASDESYYFVIYDWEKEPPCVTLLHRTVAGAEELAKIEVPKELFEASCKEGGIKPGGTVQSLNRALQDWLNARIEGPPVEWFGREH